jgi:hypothetical protein
MLIKSQKSSFSRYSIGNSAGKSCLELATLNLSFPLRNVYVISYGKEVENTVRYHNYVVRNSRTKYQKADFLSTVILILDLYGLQKNWTIGFSFLLGEFCARLASKFAKKGNMAQNNFSQKIKWI